ncbi:MAG TPA: UvrD-helicase domain-containing protein [Acidobacteriaceae bacterium]|nr:UvrD-helicase domain-containing protein [Acidobacteriaceae bacterium]
MPDPLIVDAAARATAIEITRSVIVQAPAGSGKTDLLTRRFLRLLAAVDEPEDILAITFTRAATAEMRSRIITDLETVARHSVFPPGDLDRLALAKAALAQSERRGWNLLDHPERLAIETIDSLCLRIAHDRPLTAGLGGRLQPTEHAAPLYALAARRTLEHLGGSNAELDAALAHLLDLRDNQLAGCESLLAEMLAKRDQWIHVLPLSGQMTEDDWDAARVHLEAPFRREVRRVLTEAHRLVDAEPTLRDHLLGLAQYACDNGNDSVAGLAGMQTFSPGMSLQHWQCVSEFLTREGEWRKAVDKRHGFPAGPSGSQARQNKDAMVFLLTRLRQLPNLLDVLCAIRELPPETYSEAQWLTLRHVLTVLRRSIAELKIVFAQQNSVDFTEISLAALDVLKEAPDRAAINVRHLLIDEFQDTSRRQHHLVTELLKSWDPTSNPGERTVFLVGDPMQSIYMFRQAEVELFTQVRDHGLGPADNRIPCEPVQLSVNFRSHVGITAPLNEFFQAICASPAPPGSAAVAFAPATASDPAPRPQAVHVYPQLIPNSKPTRAECHDARNQEARDVLQILQRHLPLIERARAEHREYRVAVLVRSRPHLNELVPLLRQHRIPFRAVEIERLSERQELRDLLALTRALLHPMDRIAWLSVLRAPWCGLTLPDLHLLTGSDNRDCKNLPVLELIDRQQHLLSTDGQQRLAHTAQILRRALDLRWRPSESPSFASWIERTWRTLGGPSVIDAAAYENTQVFFSLLDAVTPDGLAPLTPAFAAELDRLFAQPDPAGAIELMTIHKAKGLGFEVVIVPGLDRKSATDSQSLIASLERRDPFNPTEDEFLVAPIGPKGDESAPLYKWVVKQRKIRFDEERKRLFYVACTRARQELHLLGTAVVATSGIKPENAGSLLSTAWPALHADFEALALQQPAAPSNVIAFPSPGKLEELAAATDPVPQRGPRRLPIHFNPIADAQNVTATGANLTGQPTPPEFHRPEGSRLSRIIGSAVHALLQRSGSQLAQLDRESLRARAGSLLRASALSGDALVSATTTVTNLLSACAADPVCQWILAPHPEAQSETAWSSLSPDARLRTIRADRVFRAGSAPLASGSDCLWVIDYKTGPASSPDRAAFLTTQRNTYAPQLLAYARALRAIHGPEIPIRLGLYYPAIATLDHWDPVL